MATEIDISQLPTKKKDARIVMVKAKILYEMDFTMDLILESILKPTNLLIGPAIVSRMKGVNHGFISPYRISSRFS